MEFDADAENLGALLFDDDFEEVRRPRSPITPVGEEEIFTEALNQPNRPRFYPDPNVERQITSLAQVSNLFPEESLETIRSVLEANDYDTETVITRLNDGKLTKILQGGDTSVPNFVPDEQKAPKRKITSPGPELGPQTKQTKSLPESSGVVPKRHTPEEIEIRIDLILGMFPNANDRGIRHRLEESADLDTVLAEVINELENSEKTDEAPGPSKWQPTPTPQVKIDRKMEEYLSNEDKENLVHVTQIFPDVDPHFVFEQIAIQRKTLEDIVNRMTNNSSYPKLKQRLEKERQERRRQEFLNSEQFDIESYLHLFENPEIYFNDQTRNMTHVYVRHAKVHLMNLFRNMREAFLQRQLEIHNNHFLPTFRTITEGISQTDANGRRKKQRNFGMPMYKRELGPETPWPDEIDEMFFRELQYLQHQNQIRDFIEERTRQREQREHEAEVKGQLIECQCCFNNNKLPEDMIACQQNNQHVFCRDCIHQHAETQVSEVVQVTNAEYNIKILQNLLRPACMDILLRRRQQDEVRNAQLDNMESCPFCDFAMVIENTNENVFKCQNPNCLRESCRQCQEPNHIPKRCNEVEKDAEVRMRTYIENKMAEAWIRICPKCNKRLIKTSGCNALHCPCGTGICYVCNQVLPKDSNGYDHFELGFLPRSRNRDDHPAKHPSCPLHTSMNEVNADVAERAGKEARAMYLKENPEVEEKANIDDQHVEQLVDRDANNGRRGEGDFVQAMFAAAERHMGRLGGEFMVERRPEIRQFVVENFFGGIVQDFAQINNGGNRRQDREREMRRIALFEHRHADLNPAQERRNLMQQQENAQRRVDQIYRRRQQHRQNVDNFERNVLRLERMIQGLQRGDRRIMHHQDNLEHMRRSREDALTNLEQSTIELADATAELNRIEGFLDQDNFGNVAGLYGNEREEQRAFDVWQREQIQHHNERRVMETVTRLRRLHGQMTRLYGNVALLRQRQSNKSTDEQRQLHQLNTIQNNLLERLNRHFARDPGNFNDEIERDAWELNDEINEHLNEMRQFIRRANHQPDTKNAEASSSAATSAAADMGKAVTKTGNTESVRENMKAICQALKGLPEGSSDEARRHKKEAVQNLKQQLTGLQKEHTAKQQKKEGDQPKKLPPVSKPAAVLPVAKQSGRNASNAKKMKHLKEVNQRIDILDGQLKDAQRKVNKDMPDGQSLLNLMQQRDDTIAERNDLEASLLEEGVEEKQFRRNDGQYDFTQAENAEAMHLARNAVFRGPPCSVHPGFRIGFQDNGELGIENEEPTPMLSPDPDVQDAKQVIHPMPNKSVSNSGSTSAKQKSYGKAEQNVATLEAHRQAMICEQEMHEQQMLNEHDRLNQESRAVQKQMEQLCQREREIREQMAISEQRLAQSRERHSTQIDRLNGRVHEMQINSPNQSQEAPSASARGDEPPVRSESVPTVLDSWDLPTEQQQHPSWNAQQPSHVAQPSWDNQPIQPRQLWASYPGMNGTPGQQQQHVPFSNNQWFPFSSVRSGIPIQPKMDSRVKSSGTNNQPQRRTNMDAWASHIGARNTHPTRTQENPDDTWATYFGRNSPEPQTNEQGWNTWHAPNTERAHSWFNPPALRTSPGTQRKKAVEAFTAKLTNPGETSERPQKGEVAMEADEPQSTVVLIEEDETMDSDINDKARVQEGDNKEKRINNIVERVKESIPNVERQEVVQALLKVRQNLGANFGKQSLSELVRLVVSELKPVTPVCSVIPNSRSSKESNMAIPQSTPALNQPVIGDQNREETPSSAQSNETVASQNFIPKIESQPTQSSAESDASSFSMRIGLDGQLNINIQLPRTQSQQSTHSSSHLSQESVTQPESDQIIGATNLESKTDNGDAEFANIGNENQI